MKREIDTNTRKALHHLVQVLAACARAYQDPQPDDLHTALDWDPQARAFSVTLDANTLSLIVESATLEWRRGGRIETSNPGGRTRAGLEERMRRWLELMGLDHTPFTLNPPYDLPPAVFPNGLFQFDSGTLEALSDMYAATHRALTDMAWIPGSSPVRTWPHHFDMAVLVKMGAGRTIGLGFSPGDDSHPQPYYYATPWPYPDKHSLNPAPAGWEWNTEGWVGLRREVSATGDSEFDGAFEACAVQSASKR